jgi:hypothetical protein
VKAVVALGAAYYLSQNAPECRQPVPTTPAPEPLRRAPRPLGTVLVSRVSGSSNATFVVADVLEAAGWSVLFEEDRRALEAEQRRYGGGAPGAQVRYFATVRSEFSSGREYDRSQSGRYSSSGDGGREVLCTVYLRVADGAGVTFSGAGRGSSWSRYDRSSWRSRGWSSSSRYYSPDDKDLALLAAMVAASNQVIAQAVPPAAYAITPNHVGGSSSSQAEQVHFCPGCGKHAPQGANFCPHCGAKLAPPPRGAPAN